MQKSLKMIREFIKGFTNKKFNKADQTILKNNRFTNSPVNLEKVENQNISYNIISKKFNPYKKIIQIPPLLSSNFTGREEYIKEIETLLTKQEVIVLSGTGGIGKTQIVLRYIELNRHQYKHIAFINASSGETITQDYAGYLDIDNDENTVNRMKDWVSVNKNWLFVYDNLDDDTVKTNFLKKYMVDTTNGNIIITSRLSNCKANASKTLLTNGL